jgi:hypothetical protein
VYKARLCAAFLIWVSTARAQPTFPVDGDPIGADTSTTDEAGGFTAVEQVGVNLGQPAIEVTLNGQELLTELRVIVFGLPSADGELLFNRFDYHLDVWPSSDYFAGTAPQFRVDLGQPSNVSLVPAGPNRIVPADQFGTSGISGSNAPTYDFRFDLTEPQNIFDSPLAAGNWTFGFQSWHDTQESGTLRVSGSTALDGPLPLFSRHNTHPRGILGGQDPNDISVYWAITLNAMVDVFNSEFAGDFNGDNVVDTADYVVWRKNLGAAEESSVNFNGDGLNGVDVADYLLWRQNLGVTSTAAAAQFDGDFNADNSVDTADFVLWRKNIGALTESNLNNNGDGINGVDVGDYQLWRQNFGRKTTSGNSAAVVAEPTNATLLMIAGCGLLYLTRLRQRIEAI